MPRASRRVRFEEVTPAHEYAAFFSVSIALLVAHLGLPIFDGYDDLDDLQLTFLTLPSGETVTLGEYAGVPGTSIYIDVAMQNIPQIIFDSCQQLRVSRPEIEWVHPDWQVGFEELCVEHGEIEGIKRSSTAALSQSEDREPIDCFYYALEIYTRQKFPEHWAMLQHNLGLAYFDRIKGERWENLQKSIECYQKSLEVFTQDKFPKKWQINQEDLIQSQEALKIEEQNISKLVPIVKLLKAGIDEEFQDILSDITYEWRRQGITTNEITRKQLLLIIDFYRGKFIYWIRLDMRLDKIFSLMKTK